MTSTTSEFRNLGVSPFDNDTQAAIDAGVLIGEPRPIDDDALSTVLVPAGAALSIIDPRAINPELDERPARKRGTAHVQNSESFIDYLAKHALPETEVYADGNAFALVAVINAHQDAKDRTAVPDAVAADAGAGWGDHRVSLELITTKPWREWVQKDRKWLTQQEFAEHLEDNSMDVTDPDSATMLEIAQSLIASTETDFKSAIRLPSGEVQFRYEETTGARAGQTGDLDIPTEFAIELAPFVGGAPAVVRARFRYRLRNGNLTLSYHLVRPEAVLEEAFSQHVEQVRAAIDSPVYAGRPA